MKYGLMVFNKTRNIGDDIQSYVAMKYLPKIDYFIDRENLDDFIPADKEKVAVIMNGWYIHNTLNWPPSPYIEPLPVSMHFTSRHFWDMKNANPHINGYGADYLKSIAPIGCRDTHTLKLLSDKGIETEFTGCLTLTTNKFEGIQKQEYICAVDVSEKVLEKIKSSTNLEVKEITHEVSEDYYKLSWDERIKNVEELLKTYQGAKCVITSRLHCGLPCTALNTPVLIIHDKYHDDRFIDYLKYIDFCYEEDFIKEEYSYDFANPKPNKTEHLKIRNDLDERCKEFIKKCEEDNTGSNELLPDTKFYSDFVISKSNWYKDVARSLENQLRKTETSNINNQKAIAEKDIKINNLENANNDLTNKYNDVSYKLNHIETSRLWRACKKFYKIRDKIVGNK